MPTEEPKKPEEEKPALPEEHRDGVSKGEEKKEEKPTPVDHLVESQHTLTIGGKELKYTVVTGTMVLKEETADREKKAEGEKPKAQVFFTAYTKDGVKDKSKRPVTFSFNGGPGSASVWMHLGMLGPRRVVLEFDGNLPQPPFQLTDNEYSLLDETDLVFIDPVSTGYSRPVEGQKPKEWHGFKKDIQSVGDFIRLYTTRYGRWLSPKFLIGESYGTTRAAGLAGYLQERHGLYLNGVMLISSVLDFTTLDFNSTTTCPTSCLARLRCHGLVSQKAASAPSAAKPAERSGNFRAGRDAAALLKGDGLTRRERDEVVEKLARYTGLSPVFILRSNLRINDQHFFKELLRDRNRTVGRLDSRFIGRDRWASPSSPNTIRC